MLISLFIAILMIYPVKFLKPQTKSLPLSVERNIFSRDLSTWQPIIVSIAVKKTLIDLKTLE